jgi:hypothetical protein
MKSNVTRREFAGVVLAPASLLAQATPAAGDELTAAKQQTQRNADQLRKFKVPMATEPSIVFKP